MYAVADSILKLHREDEKAFRLNFSAAAFKERFATERQEQGNPFEGAAELDESNFEWRRPRGSTCSGAARSSKRCAMRV